MDVWARPVPGWYCLLVGRFVVVIALPVPGWYWRLALDVAFGAATRPVPGWYWCEAGFLPRPLQVQVCLLTSVGGDRCGGR